MANHFIIESPVKKIEKFAEEYDMLKLASARKSLEENLIKDDAEESNAHLSNDDEEVNEK